MKTLYLDCGMGAAGDMLTAALLELLPEREKVVEELNALGIGVETVCERTQKCGIGGTHISVRVHGEEESEEMHGGHMHDSESHHDHEAEHRHDHDHAHTHETEHHHDHAHTHEAEHTHAHEAEHAHEHSHTHHHSGMHEIAHIVGGLPLSERIRKDILAVFGMIAEAESHVHGVPAERNSFSRGGNHGCGGGYHGGLCADG